MNDEGLTEMDSRTKENTADPNQNLEYTKTLQEPEGPRVN